MNYLEVYKRRVGHLGTTPQEKAYQSGILEFRRYLKYNEHTEHNLSLDNSDTVFSGVILTDKEDENRVSQILLVKVTEDGGPELKPGNLVWWGEDKYPWIIYRSTTSSYQPHQKFYMVRCNYEVKWLDSEGMLHSSWIYLLGSKDSKIKDNFRTWHSVITPQPNKYINIMMPHQLMPLGTEIMVLDEVWSLVDYDQNSVPGVIYMSFTETNLNEQRDSIEDKLANADMLADWQIEMAESRVVAADSIIDISYAITKNGVIQNVKPEIILTDGLKLMNDGCVQVGTEGGTITIDYKGVRKSQEIIVDEQPKADILFIGSDKIRVASEKNIYTLENATEEVIFTLIDENNLIAKAEQDGNTFIITANSKNKLGDIILTAEYNGKKFIKNIKIVSLWQVI